MPTIGQAPPVIPLPVLSADEARDRTESLEEAFKLHRAVMGKLDSVLASLAEAGAMVEKLQHVSTSVPSNRAVRLSRRLGLDVLLHSLRGASSLVKAASGTRRAASRGRDEAEKLVLDPGLLR